MATKSYDILYKLLLIGDSDVGKLRILFRLADEPMNSTFMSTIGIDFKCKTVIVDGKRIKLQIWDTAGQERYHTITSSYYRGANGIMLVYDITNAKSFENIAKWLTNINEQAPDYVKILVGNNCQMEDLRAVSKEQGESFALVHGMEFFEVSANNNINVDAAFRELVDATYNKANAK